MPTAERNEEVHWRLVGGARTGEHLEVSGELVAEGHAYHDSSSRASRRDPGGDRGDAERARRTVDGRIERAPFPSADERVAAPSPEASTRAGGTTGYLRDGRERSGPEERLTRFDDGTRRDPAVRTSGAS